MSAYATSAAGSGALVECFEPCLLQALAILDSAARCDGGAVFDVSAIREQLHAGLDHAALQAAGQCGTQTILLARRIVTAWIDERFASDAWPEREAWRARPLQSDWGEGRTAGEWFFEALSRLEPSRNGDVSLAVLALRCLALDFDGKMHYTPLELLELRRTTARRFSLVCSPVSFPPPLAEAGAEKTPGGAWRWWLVPLAAMAALAVFYYCADKHLETYLEARAPMAAARS